jgi:hypothetical protein
MNTRSAREYTMYAPTQLLRNWSEQRPSNQGDPVTPEVRRVYYTGWTGFWFNLCTVVRDCCWVAF